MKKNLERARNILLEQKKTISQLQNQNQLLISNQNDIVEVVVVLTKTTTILNSNKIYNNNNNNNNSNHTKSKDDKVIVEVSNRIISSLNDQEKRYFELFKSVAKHNNLQDKVELRVSGGWVRNKLLSIDSSSSGYFDIDIAISGITGREFVDLIEHYRIEHGLSQKKYLVRRNPDKSKHLETASIVIDGYTFDFTGLRAEQYDTHTRIPQIVDGTPTTDAFRRDITINSLYFNLETYRVEDFTGNGIDDLCNKYIRTPLSPHITLIEDPLRALRVLRFATRFHFNIDPSLYRSIESIEVRSALGYKVSKERIKNEFSLMMSSYDSGAIQYFRYLVDTNLVDVVFQSTGSIQITKEDWLLSLNYLEHSLRFKHQLSKEMQEDFILGVLMLPLKLKYHDALNLEYLLEHFKSSKKQVRTVLSIISSPEILINQVIKTLLLPSMTITKESLTQPHLFDQITLPLLGWLRNNECWQMGLSISAVHSEIINLPIAHVDKGMN
ncbi:tRNA ADENILYL transferase [Heterostelium album PN500]|uniref:tRNA ADENILYL transferase n=1 Tax=Heterostelium pallidum (strain ATCC 26659 / Pp 5 / PN500) TaxID=670386 RepID=D3BGI0_HETP5|nr:tRNA ADENILYL transferase [Heterostelium album PN500]EFA79580.1 tRNA ADENILYL transferase [Heterostelium album PN500]|eukprot:XP_020431701.1 tRNA ADENILYL transferase [Heterostelium album PN500]